MSVGPSLDFDSWFKPLDIDEFKRNIFARSPHFVAPVEGFAKRIVDTLDIASLDDVFELRGSKVYAWFERRDGRHTVAPIPASSARRFYDAGTTIYLRRTREFSSFEQEIAQHFGVPRNTVECSLFCNPAKAVTPAHFDRGDLIVVQLRGRKTWRIAQNEFAPMPLVAWGTRDPITSDVRLYAHGVPPSDMPSGPESSAYHLEPGSILHLPRGYWHDTITEEDSLSLHVTISSTTRLDVLIHALKNELSRDPWWRGPAYDLSAAEPSAMGEATATCNALREAVSRLDPRDLIRLPASNRAKETGTRFARCGQASFGIDAVMTRTETARVTITYYGYRETTSTTLELSIEFVAACEWIHTLSSGTEFDVPALLRAAPGLEMHEAMELLGLLEQARFIRRQT